MALLCTKYVYTKLTEKFLLCLKAETVEFIYLFDVTFYVLFILHEIMTETCKLTFFPVPLFCLFSINAIDTNSLKVPMQEASQI